MTTAVAVLLLASAGCAVGPRDGEGPAEELRAELLRTQACEAWDQRADTYSTSDQSFDPPCRKSGL
jgi:hypothetical protein